MLWSGIVPEEVFRRTEIRSERRINIFSREVRRAIRNWNGDLREGAFALDGNRL